LLAVPTSKLSIHLATNKDPTEMHPTQKLYLAFSLTALLSTAPVMAADDAEAPAQDADTLIATVNEAPYQLDIFRAFYNERLTQSRSQNTPEFQEQVFNEFLNLIVAAQEAEKRDLDENREVKAAIELQRLMVLSSAVLQEIGTEAEITDAELEDAYEELKERAKRTEYKARHILVDEQAKAEELIAKLDEAKGKGFEDLAKENSLGPTADKGGDLGWFDARQMVKPFSDAVAKLEPGSYTDKPVQTQFGWHVILLEETRDAEPPTMEEAKPTLEAAIRRQKISEALAELRTAAKIELNTDVVKLKDDEAEDE
jgi:peptidyl-prolyl cis-trans isomerase C